MSFFFHIVIFLFFRKWREVSEEDEAQGRDEAQKI